MKTERQIRDLVDGLLTDEGWQMTASQSQAGALRALRRRRHIRAISSIALQSTLFLTVVAAFLMISGAFHQHPRSVVAAVTAPSPVVSKDTTSPYISEQQLLAMLPKGSCVIAEVNGVRQLVFLDTKQHEDAN